MSMLKRFTVLGGDSSGVGLSGLSGARVKGKTLPKISLPKLFKDWQTIDFGMVYSKVIGEGEFGKFILPLKFKLLFSGNEGLNIGTVL